MSSLSGPGWDEFEIEDTDDDNNVEGLKDEDPGTRSEPGPVLNGAGSDVAEDQEAEFDSDGSCHSGSSFTHIDSAEESACRNINPSHVRWFYRQDGDKKWTPFIGYDSLRLEVRYRIARGETYDESLVDSLSEHEKDLLFRGERLVVRGGLYEVDVSNRSCHSMFWTGEQSVLTRGTWFYDGTWQPIEDPFAETIEEEHCLKFHGRDPREFPPSSPRRTVSEAIHNVQFTDFHVDWYGASAVYLYSETKSSKIMRSVSERLGLQKPGYKIQRGYFCDAQLTDRQPDITHLVFVVHGIGQKMDNEKIIRNCGSLRKCSTWLKEKYFSHLNESKERSEFFPVEWRSSLKLDGDTVESITPHRVRGLRDFLNCSALDVLYYTSPRYRSELICGLRDKMNGLYLQFCLRNPHFERDGGRISIVAHSLGAVISYDIITSWNPFNLSEAYVGTEDDAMPESENCDPDLVLKMNDARPMVSELDMPRRSKNYGRGAVSSKKNGLAFSIENFFCLGSPLAVFLALHGVRPQPRGARDDILPTSLVHRLFNVYHPTDPVAYRLEPLILKHYTSILPLSIHYYGAADKVPYEMLKIEYLTPEALDKRPHSPLADDTPDSASASPSKAVRGVTAEGRWSSYWPSFMRRKSPAPAMQMRTLQAVEDSDADEGSVDLSPTEDVGDSSGSLCATSDASPEPIVELEHRLDFVLREGNLESSYISALTSHTAYWNSYDVAYFILSYLHPTASEEAPWQLTRSPHSDPEQ